MKITVTLQDQPDGSVYTNIKFDEGFSLENPPKTPAMTLLATVFNAIEEEAAIYNLKVGGDDNGDR